ncbi:MAG: OB-fold domain-containing protein [Thermodesulfobacteriota bacterium]
MANYDEDSVTMAVAAGAEALEGMDASQVEGLFLASTTMPYKERLNSGIVAPALGLANQVRATDVSGALKCGTSALLAALDSVRAGQMQKALVCAADCRLGLPASTQEMVVGDAAAALVIGGQDCLAQCLGAFSITYDFVDHYRGQFAKADRQWEDRWIRDAGLEKFIPEAIQGLLAKCGLAMEQISKVVYPCAYPAARMGINKKLGIAPEKEVNPLLDQMGDSGSAHPLLMFCQALEQAQPGDKIVLVGVGNGCDALLWEATPLIKSPSGRSTVAQRLEHRTELTSYTKYLVWRDLLQVEAGLRSEEDLWTRWSVNWRQRDALLGLWGSRCTACGTVQFPAQRVCANPDCGATDQMQPERMAGKTGTIFSYTGDMLAASDDPPVIYGHIVFEGGGKYAFNFTDCDLESLRVGQKVRMSFRRKYYDKKRDIVGYFWKAVPVREEK